MKTHLYASRHIRWLALALTLVLLSGPGASSQAGQPSRTTIRVDASKRVNRISPLLYGHFAEFMFEDIKGGLWAELLRNRAFEDMAPRPSVAHYWERYPDNRNDDYSLIFGGSRFGLAEDGYPKNFRNRAQIMICTSEDNQPRGMHQSEIPVSQGMTYRGAWRLASSVHTPVAYQPADPELGKDIPALDVVASTTEDGERIVLKVVNTSFTEDIQGELKLAHLARSLAPEASVTTINGPESELQIRLLLPIASAPEGPLSLAWDRNLLTRSRNTQLPSSH